MENNQPIISVDRKVEFINAAESGIFIPRSNISLHGPPLQTTHKC